MASTAEELAAQAEQLQGSIAFFKIGTAATAAQAGRQGKRDQGFKKAVPQRKLSQSRPVTSGVGIQLSEDDELLEAGFERY